MNDRRTFLRGLATLPLIGGSVAILGAPQAVAEPVTETLLWEYASWLGHEHDRVSYELHGHRFREAMRHRHLVGPAADFHRSTYGDGDWDAFGNHSPTASTRAALVLSTVGCDWRRER